MLRLLSLTLATVICVSSASSSAQADASGQFYEKDAASTVFGPDVVVVPKPRQEARKDDPKDKKSKIVSEFGNPAEDVPVLAMTTAPKPFQGMMKAMQEGESDLAYQYAKQYARYLRDFQDRTSRAAGLTQLGMVSEGTLSKSAVDDSPLAQTDLYRLEEDLKLQREQQNAFLKEMSPEALELIERADAEEAGKAQIDPAKVDQSNPEFEKSERTKARLALSNRALPVAANGEVDIYFFFRTTDEKALRMLTAIDGLGMIVSTEKGVHVSAKVMNIASENSLRRLRDKFSLGLSLENGTALANELGIQQSPATVFIVKGSNQAVVEEGERSLYYLDEVLSQIRLGARG